MEQLHHTKIILTQVLIVMFEKLFFRVGSIVENENLKVDANKTSEWGDKMIELQTKFKYEHTSQ